MAWLRITMREEINTIQIVRLAWLRTFRKWHWIPKIYEGVNGVKTNLLVIGWIGIEYYPDNPQNV